MDLKRIKNLAELMGEAGLTHLELWEGEDKVILSKGVAAAAIAVPQPAAPIAETPAAPAEQQASAASDENALVSPLVGCVYLGASPDAKPYVGVGTAVKKGQVLCIVEAMKVMNEFTSPRDGVIAEVCVENGQLVEYGQPLFCLQ